MKTLSFCCSERENPQSITYSLSLIISFTEINPMNFGECPELLFCFILFGNISPVLLHDIKRDENSNYYQDTKCAVHMIDRQRRNFKNEIAFEVEVQVEAMWENESKIKSIWIP